MLKWFFGGLLVIVLIMLAWWFAQDANPPQRADMMPWQVTVDEHGFSRVFGVTLQKTTLAEAVKKFGREGEVALFSRGTDNDRLEAYFHNVQLGPVIAKVVVTLATNREEMAGIRERSVKQENTPSGIYRYTLNQQDTGVALQRSIEAITYIPSYLSLDEEMVRTKFGEPDSVSRIDEQRVRWFYPKRGLALLIDRKGKEIMQYVPIDQFEDLKLRLDGLEEGKEESGR